MNQEPKTQGVEEVVKEFLQKFPYDEDSEMYYPADYSGGLPAPSLPEWLSTKLAEAYQKGREDAVDYIEDGVGLEATTHFLELCAAARHPDKK